MKRLRIAIVVPGRFHAFDLGRALLDLGHEVTIFTNYPARVVARFGFPADHVCRFLVHGVSSRAIQWITRRVGVVRPEAALHRGFGRWAVRVLHRSGPWDVVHVWSGVAEEVLSSELPGQPLMVLMRGSAHIRVQERLLRAEEERVGVPVCLPSQWMIAREEREYALADRIMLLSSFARDSFVEEDESVERLGVNALAASVTAFRCSPEAAEAREVRIRSGGPLQLLYVGALSAQKGLLDLISMAQRLPAERFTFTLVGPRVVETDALLAAAPPHVRIIPKQPQHTLTKWYAEGDLFVFPTIQDGFAVVLAQACAAGLPLLATRNCAGPDLISEGVTGWVLPIRSPEAFVERLRWADDNREALAEMARHVYAEYQPRAWVDVAQEFVELCRDGIADRRTKIETV